MDFFVNFAIIVIVLLGKKNLMLFTAFHIRYVQLRYWRLG